MARITKKPRTALHTKSLAKPFANRKQDERYWSAEWRKLRHVFLRENPLCVKCEWPANVVDHIHPVTQGGQFYDIDNLQPLCTPCHNRKSAKEKGGTTGLLGHGLTTTTK